SRGRSRRRKGAGVGLEAAVKEGLGTWKELLVRSPLSRLHSTYNYCTTPGTALAVHKIRFLHQEMLMFRPWPVVVLLFAVASIPAIVAAQDSGQYAIQNAQYGTALHHIDVTPRLKELARRDRTFRMGNSTFGTDPDPGQPKTLRIFARGPNGGERM